MKDPVSKKTKNTLKWLTERREPPKASIILYIILYLVLSGFTGLSSRSDDVLMIGGNMLSVSSLAGVFSSLSNIYLVVMVLYYKNLGMLVSVGLLLSQVPILLSGILIRHNLMSLPGLFSSLFTIILLVVVHIHQIRVGRAYGRMQRLFEQTATSLINAIDAKDVYTHGH